MVEIQQLLVLFCLDSRLSLSLNQGSFQGLVFWERAGALQDQGFLEGLVDEALFPAKWEGGNPPNTGPQLGSGPWRESAKKSKGMNPMLLLAG